MTRRRRIYIAGPLSTGDRLANVQLACAVGRELIVLGYAPLIPHLTHYMDCTDELGHATWLDVDLPWVEVADGLLRLPGPSKGADMEEERAEARGIPIYLSKQELLAKTTPTIDGAGDPRFHAVLAEMGYLHARKGADYGRGKDVFANIRASEDFGVPPWVGAMVRANDKVQRIKSYCLNGSLANEGLEDSLIDLACYAIIALILFRETDKG